MPRKHPTHCLALPKSSRVWIVPWPKRKAWSGCGGYHALDFLVRPFHGWFFTAANNSNYAWTGSQIHRKLQLHFFQFGDVKEPLCLSTVKRTTTSCESSCGGWHGSNWATVGGCCIHFALLVLDWRSFSYQWSSQPNVFLFLSTTQPISSSSEWRSGLQEWTSVTENNGQLILHWESWGQNRFLVCRFAHTVPLRVSGCSVPASCGWQEHGQCSCAADIGQLREMN